MKKFASFVFFVSIVFNCFSQRSIIEDQKIQLAMLMNQVQYTTSSIITNRDREFLNQEFDFIINQIDKSKLYDSTIKGTYTDLLETLKELKLNENEKRFIMEQNEREKKQAYTKALSSFGSVFNAGFSPASLVASLAYAGVSAGLNIMSARYEADNKLKEQLFRIGQKEQEKIDDSRINLFRAYTNVITSYGIPVKYEITESVMKDFIRYLNEKKNDHKGLIKILEAEKAKFELFPVFWFQLGAQYQIDKNYTKALECYDKFENLKKNYSYLRTDPYYISVAKNKIEILKEQGLQKNRNVIFNYLKIIEDNMIPENGSENRVFLASCYFELGQNEKAKTLLRLNLARNEFYSVSSDMLALIEYEESKNNNTLNPALLLELSNIECALNPNKNSSFGIIVPKKFGLGKFAYIKYDKKIYPFPYVLTSDKDFLNIDLNLDFDEKKSNELSFILLSRNNQIIQLDLSVENIKKNDKALNLLKEINMTLEDIEPCMISNLIKALDGFSYKAKEDKEYLDLVEEHMRMTNTKTSREQKQLYHKEEDEKLKELEVKGRLRAILTCISEVTKDLQIYPYFVSKASFDDKGNALVYSYKKIRYFNDFYEFPKYGIGIKSPVSANEGNVTLKSLAESASMDAGAQYNLSKAYLTGGADWEKEAERSFRYLVLSAINGNVDAQFDLATVYSDFSSKISKYYIDSNIVIPENGIINTVKTVLVRAAIFEWPAVGLAINYAYNKAQNKSQNEIIASYWFQKAADGGNGAAVFKIAKRYEDGIGIEKNADKAQEYYRKAYYEFGNLDAEKKITK